MTRSCLNVPALRIASSCSLSTRPIVSSWTYSGCAEEDDDDDENDEDGKDDDEEEEEEPEVGSELFAADITDRHAELLHNRSIMLVILLFITIVDDNDDETAAIIYLINSPVWVLQSLNQ